MTETITKPDAPAAHPLPAWTLGLSIAGEPVIDRAEPVAVYDPATEAELARVPQADTPEVLGWTKLKLDHIRGPSCSQTLALADSARAQTGRCPCSLR
jgi:hypothetical protein